VRLIIRYFPNVFLLFNGLIYLFLAYLFLTDASSWFIRLGISPSQEVGFTELRAMYLGLMFAIGVFVIISSRLETFQLPGLLFLLISYALLGLVRGYGMFVEGMSNQLMLNLFMAELSSTILTIVALICFKKNSSDR
tara:strand:+ start:537 stop:947 length:411 start_codon:yes stop_codon:yes gene_type:complete